MTYDTDTRVVEVTCEESVDAEVFLYDGHDNTIGYSPCINTTLPVENASTNSAIIYIESENWSASAEIEL